MDSLSKPRDDKLIVGIVAVIVAVVVILSVFLYSRILDHASASDRDFDTVPDAEDAFPDDPTEWADTDGDGHGDNSDAFPLDPTRWATTPVATYSRSPVTNGQQVNIVAITQTGVPWDDIKIQLTDGTNIAEWEIATADLDGGSAASANYSTVNLGTLTICCWVFDVAGNGLVGGADYFKVFTYGGAPGFSSGTDYTAVLIYTETGEKIGTGVTFTG